MAQDIDTLVKILWDYLLVGHSLKKADCIFMLGSYDLRVADYAIDLWKAEWAPMLLFSGGVIQDNARLNVHWDLPEADYFARHAIERGVPADKILVENRAMNTGDNFTFTTQLLEKLGLNFQSFILVQKPFMERRTLATALKLWADKDFVVTSPLLTYEDYMNGDLHKEELIHYIVGDFQRVKVYAENGFQAPQDIPAQTWSAYEQLVALGYDTHLAKI